MVKKQNNGIKGDGKKPPHLMPVVRQQQMNEPYITIDTYHEYMCEAFCALRSGLSYFGEAQEDEEDDHHRHWMFVESGMQCRYAFLLASNALEAAANALLLGLEANNTLYTDLEKLPTLLKFEIFCISRGKN